MSFQDESRYVNHDPFDGDRDADLRLVQVRMVTTRKPHKCLGSIAGEVGPHDIPVGTRARFEKALVDGDYWGRYYVCTACMDRELSVAEGDDD